MTSKSEDSADNEWRAGHIRYEEQPVGLTVYPFYSTRSPIASVGYAMRLQLSRFVRGEVLQ